MTAREKVARFNREYLAYMPVLRDKVRRILNRREDEVQDVLQDAWIRGAKAVLRSEVTHYKSWLYRLAASAALDHIKASRRRLPPDFSREKEQRLIDAIDPGPPPDELAIRRQVREALGELGVRSPKLAAIVHLVCVLGYTHVEAAHALGIPIGTAQSNAYRGIAALRESLTAPKAA